VVPEQLTFELAAPAPPTFANFLPGDNQELVDVLVRAAAGRLAETGVVLWGPPGVGKSHLLAATLAAARAAGRTCTTLAPDDEAPPALPADTLVTVDDVDARPAVQQGVLFTLYNQLAAGGGHLVAAALGPPARVALRDDLRTRLGHGLVYEVLPLRDAAKPAALSRYAAARGLPLGDEVIEYLLARYPRDMPTLLAAIDVLDRRSLAAKRAVTVAFVREALADARK
jgi:DnaA-homolog protein